ncbi:MAG TPA: hypothetical protein VEA41_13990 [Salinarimonas sp.]|nr:hypothetical protein [Salinarimonas sp.]
MMSDRDRPAREASPPPAVSSPGGTTRSRPHLRLAYCRDRDGAPGPAPAVAPADARGQLTAYAALLAAVTIVAAFLIGA